jgi:protein arginine kinase activator
MLCERCKKNIANVHVIQINNNEKVELYLCEQCAKETESIHFDTPISFQDFLTGFLDMPLMGKASSKEYSSQGTTLQCPSCKMTYDEFSKIGRFGCAQCYTAFSSRLMPIIKNVHGNNEHVGKLPSSAAGELKIKRELEMLKKELKEAIRLEEFERAAQLRDKIRSMEQGGEQ